MNLSCEMKMGMLDDLRNQTLGRYAFETAAIVGTGGSLSSHFRGVMGQWQASHRISGNFLIGTRPFAITSPSMPRSVDEPLQTLDSMCKIGAAHSGKNGIELEILEKSWWLQPYFKFLPGSCFLIPRPCFVTKSS